MAQPHVQSPADPADEIEREIARLDKLVARLRLGPRSHRSIHDTADTCREVAIALDQIGRGAAAVFPRNPPLGRTPTGGGIW